MKNFTSNLMAGKQLLKLLLPACLLLGSIPAQSVVRETWHNPLSQPFPVIRGRGWQENNYARLPEQYKDSVRQAVWNLSRESAGLSVAFRSNAPEIKVKYVVEGSFAMPHMPATGVSGVDLYSTDRNGNRHWCAAKYAFGDTVRYDYRNLGGTSDGWGYEYHLYLPPYNTVKWMEIGVPQGSSFKFIPTSEEKPIVMYGTSIAQGACASRPGMVWGNIVERETDNPFVNLGFSGNGKLEPELFRILAAIPAKLYIIDCMPNLTGKDTTVIVPRILEGVRILRATNPSPILLVEHCGYLNEATSAHSRQAYQATNRALRKAYDTLKRQGVPDILYLTKEEIGFTEDSQVEGVHANDIGMRRYANAYIKKIRQILQEGNEPRIFKARKQQRDSYDWNERHEAVLKLNKAEQHPDILMIGNSITHFWGGEPQATVQTGPKSWKKLFKGQKVHNLGFGWDRIENMLWRVYHGELDGCQARKIVLLAGTNNLGTNTDEEIIAGIDTLLKAIHRRQPGAIIYVAGILPRKGMESRISRLNGNLKAALPDGSWVKYIDIGSGLTQADGMIRAELFRDGLHPTEQGYAAMAKCLRPYLDE